jgi:hypothetical protein
MDHFAGVPSHTVAGLGARTLINLNQPLVISKLATSRIETGDHPRSIAR